MIALAEADELHEIIRNVARDEGRDMTDMHAIADEILGMPVGESTPAPGTLKAMVAEPVVEPLIVFTPPLHEGWNEPIEGSKFILPRSAKPDKVITFRELCRQFRRFRRVTYVTLLLLATVVVVGLADIWIHWR